jgi:EAL domain-containing protein (putative c-di-GMP-specific phosphodiesterase class I)
MISLPYHTGSTSIHLSSAIGISTCPDDGTSVHELIQHASGARREAKRRGEPFLHWDPVLHARATERLKMKGELSRAFSRDEFRLLYQPIVDPSGEIRGVEALLRWRHPERGILAPGTFISILEENRSISTLTRWVLLQATEQIGHIAERHGIFFSINLSSFDLQDPDFIDVVAMAVAELKKDLQLCLELGGSMRSTGWNSIREAMQNLTALGARLMLSDFAGANAFGALLKDLPVEGVKINLSSMGSIETEPEALALTSDLAALVHHQNKKVCIEGVGNERMFAALEGIRVDYLQGFHFAEPLPIAVLDDLLSTGYQLPR